MTSLLAPSKSIKEIDVGLYLKSLEEVLLVKPMQLVLLRTFIHGITHA